MGWCYIEFKLNEKKIRIIIKEVSETFFLFILNIILFVHIIYGFISTDLQTQQPKAHKIKTDSSWKIFITLFDGLNGNVANRVE